MLDALEGVLYVDDRWVLVREMDFEIDKANPRIEIELETMAELGDAKCGMSS
ncbi:endodeoxyribonuclease RusA [Alicyclobacillus hesperidum URH17-3-68]|nr:endodeoxyribonuclease RusA [Alicyclobacillus hesperidum URH17-3-68]